MFPGHRTAGRGQNDVGNESGRESSSFPPRTQHSRILHPEGSARVGFEVVTLDGRRGTLATSIASRKSLSWPCVGKYRVDLPSFETIALPELEVKEGTDLFIIDEVGKMELFSSSFYPAVLRVFESNTPILATIPIPKYGRDIPEVSGLRNHPKATVCTLNAGNRDAIKETIYAQIVSLLREQRMGE
ncbi:nucleoside-triphosphatase THEP1 isoform X2 [Phalaenopsis equestris]|uniref:nucleoside-triphosphatase THEP1 isoform X2 n=1 Tax=Phalaenopsis equestris TaxID=78828 RepID=UPI0009E5C614|nr:nucleoside-triphosphatase THEP1 isoform X2 [Phalaenopsis equestris]